MWVSHLRLSHFRNHTDTALDLAPGITVFIGDNGQGKTNLVESLGYLAYLSSHRVSQDKALVQSGSEEATVFATVKNGSQSAQLACQIRSSGANRAKVNNNTASLGDLAGWLKVVLFTPEDLALVRGEPAVRRRYLDTTLEIIRPAARASLAEYERVVKQRNALLKTNRGRPTEALQRTLDGFNDSFVSLAADVTTRRNALIDQLQPLVQSAYATLASGQEITMGLESSDEAGDSDLTEWYRESLATGQKEEWERGMTLIGPHREDLIVELNELPARTHSSQGEAWSLALSLRMAQAQLYRQDTATGDPVMILDDVFAELDRGRRQTLRTLVEDYEQVLVTAAVPSDIPDGFDQYKRYVAEGRVTDAGV